MKAIVNATIVMPDHYIMGGTILIDGGKIVDFGKNINTQGAEIIDAQNAFVGPGLIDIHTHSAGGKWFYEEPEEACAIALRHGVTAVLPALYFNMDKDTFLQGVLDLKAARNSGKCPNLFGAYMEGPYLNPNFGCNKESNPWKDVVKKENYEKIVAEAADLAKVWCIAPERENIEQFVADVKAQIPGIVFAVAHSEAAPWQIERFIPDGLRLGTHHTNATGTIERYSETRGVCVDETVNKNDDIYAELICDSMGIHVDPYMIRYVEKIKGSDKIILISDAFVENGPRPAGYEEATDINFDRSGEIAGSNLTLDVACRNMMVHTGCSVCKAFKYASTNPANLLNLYDRGRIQKGCVADLVMVDQWFNVQNVMLKGELVK